jgi:p-aminobenzoyl-glutamate transporter AbgT
MNKVTSFFIGIIGLMVASCGSLEQDITIDLPPFERELNVECYVAPNGLQQPLTSLWLTLAYYSSRV